MIHYKLTYRRDGKPFPVRRTKAGMIRKGLRRLHESAPEERVKLNMKSSDARDGQSFALDLEGVPETVLEMLPEAGIILEKLINCKDPHAKIRTSFALPEKVEVAGESDSGYQDTPGEPHGGSDGWKGFPGKGDGGDVEY